MKIIYNQARETLLVTKCGKDSLPLTFWKHLLYLYNDNNDELNYAKRNLVEKRYADENIILSLLHERKSQGCTLESFSNSSFRILNINSKNDSTIQVRKGVFEGEEDIVTLNIEAEILSELSNVIRDNMKMSIGIDDINNIRQSVVNNLSIKVPLVLEWVNNKGLTCMIFVKPSCLLLDKITISNIINQELNQHIEEKVDCIDIAWSDIYGEYKALVQ